MDWLEKAYEVRILERAIGDGVSPARGLVL
jgi:hypothetical protein